MSDADTDLIFFQDSDPKPDRAGDRDHGKTDQEHGRQDRPAGQGPADASTTPAQHASEPAGGAEPTNTDLVIATGLDHGTGARRVFAGLDFRLAAGSLGVVHGADGSGKSTLLLALIGRAAKLHGSLQVAGYDAIREAKKLRGITTAARIGSIVDTEPKHSVTDAVRERAAIDGLRTAQATRTFAELCSVLDLRAPNDYLVEELDGYQRTVLALALACLRPSTLLVLDDAQRGLSIRDQDRLFATIGDLMAHTGSTVVVSTLEPDTIGYDAVPITLPSPGLGGA